MRAMQTPPAEIAQFRDFFDNQPESVKRAYYSLGNYMAAGNVLKCTEPVIMDRYGNNIAIVIIKFSVCCPFLYVCAVYPSGLAQFLLCCLHQDCSCNENSL